MDSVLSASPSREKVEDAPIFSSQNAGEAEKGSTGEHSLDSPRKGKRSSGNVQKRKRGYRPSDSELVMMAQTTLEMLVERFGPLYFGRAEGFSFLRFPESLSYCDGCHILTLSKEVKLDEGKHENLCSGCRATKIDDSVLDRQGGIAQNTTG